MTDSRLLETARLLSRALTPGDLDHTLRQITTAAVEVLPMVEYASITVLQHDGKLTTAAPTDRVLLPLDAAQYELREGPCYYAAVDEAHVISPDLANDARFPRYAGVAVPTGIRAQAGLRLYDAPKSKGALNLYSSTVGAFEDFESLSQLFAHQAATAIAYAQEIDDLQQAIHTRGTIGQAVGIVMERYQLNDERAFAFLTRLSQDNNIKLRNVAEEIVKELDTRSN
ncbi:GAF and ANTAR domain-containing protein [Kribbella sp. NPDC051770]|uniref:GAF and ANTAR domain-containing protein n=1 Tax=Kribbella sp. NPDC051770 TaxID=3155413 RepID=UPI00343AF48F